MAETTILHFSMPIVIYISLCLCMFVSERETRQTESSSYEIAKMRGPRIYKVINIVR